MNTVIGAAEKFPELGQTFAQMPPEVKNAHSHRGQAAREIVRQIRLRWLAE